MGRKPDLYQNRTTEEECICAQQHEKASLNQIPESTGVLMANNRAQGTAAS